MGKIVSGFLNGCRRRRKGGNLFSRAHTCKFALFDRSKRGVAEIAEDFAEENEGIGHGTRHDYYAHLAPKPTISALFSATFATLRFAEIFF
jgi:hypothetical protein